MGSCALHDLAKVLGPSVMERFLRRYAVAHAFGWSTTEGFMSAAQAVASSLPDPVDLTRFWLDHRIGRR
jgi:hypothetical protein